MEVKLLGLTTKEAVDEQIKICAAAGKLSRMKGSVFDAVDSFESPEKALKFVNRVIDMGHTATIDHDYLVFAISGVSPVVEQTIIEERFSSFTIKSRREVDFSNSKYYVPDFYDKNGNLMPNNEELKQDYCKFMDSAFAGYSKLVDAGIKKEDARFVLPYSFPSEIIMGLDGTSVVRMINSLTKGKLSNITELREFGEQLEKVCRERAPYMRTLLDKEVKNPVSPVEEELKALDIKRGYELINDPVLVSYTPDMDKTLFINAISRCYGVSYDVAKKVYEEKVAGNSEVEARLMKAIFEERNHDDLRQVNMKFNFSIPYAILTHITRHRRVSLSIPPFAPNPDLTKYVTPPSIKHREENALFEEIFANSKEMVEKFKAQGVRDEDLVYFILGGNAVNVVANFDGEAFRWICRLRECTKAQWCIREAVLGMHKKLEKEDSCKYFTDNLGPDCVTLGICGEGKESCGRVNSLSRKKN